MSVSTELRRLANEVIECMHVDSGDPPPPFALAVYQGNVQLYELETPIDHAAVVKFIKDELGECQVLIGYPSNGGNSAVMYMFDGEVPGYTFSW